ncbi:MAG: hypothetical protein OJF62_000329 [Pseudolabrys sp.]|nr:hypothetical protein [Pseudolabrys sp.]
MPLRVTQAGADGIVPWRISWRFLLLCFLSSAPGRTLWVTLYV